MREVANLNNSVRFFLTESGKVRMGALQPEASAGSKSSAPISVVETKLYQTYWSFCVGPGSAKPVGSTQFRAKMRELATEFGFKLTIRNTELGGTGDSIRKPHTCGVVGFAEYIDGPFWREAHRRLMLSMYILALLFSENPMSNDFHYPVITDHVEWSIKMIITLATENAAYLDDEACPYGVDFKKVISNLIHRQVQPEKKKVDIADFEITEDQIDSSLDIDLYRVFTDLKNYGKTIPQSDQTERMAATTSS